MSRSTEINNFAKAFVKFARDKNLSSEITPAVKASRRLSFLQEFKDQFGINYLGFKTVNNFYDSDSLKKYLLLLKKKPTDSEIKNIESMVNIDSTSGVKRLGWITGYDVDNEFDNKNKSSLTYFNQRLLIEGFGLKAREIFLKS